MKIGSLFSEKLTRDIAWTVASFAILAASGIIINLIVAIFRDATALGVFNISYAVYIVASQMAVIGIHYSVLRHSAFYESDAKERGALLLTGSALALVLGMTAAAVIYSTAPLFGDLFENKLVGDSIRYAAFGLLFFPLNKVLISYLNGLRHMRAFSVFQASRYIVVMAWVTAISLSHLPFELATLSFLIAEAVTTAAAAVYIWYAKLATEARISLNWISRHIAFGSKSLLSGMFVEMNSRVDVLLLGVFLDEKLVGIYSFAAMLVDGLYHLLAMVRVNFNPVLVATVRDKKWQSGIDLLRISKRYGFAATGGVSILIFAAFYVLATYIVPDKGLIAGAPSLMVLLVGLTAISAFVPFDNLLLVAGYPAYQTVQHLTVVLLNVVLNVSLVPIWGIEGAAFATIAGYLVGIGMLIAMCRYLIGWNLVTNSMSNR